MPKAKRGEIWIIDLGLAQRARPCLILSIDFLDHERAVVTYIPRTLHPRRTRFEVPHQARGFEPGAFDAQGSEVFLLLSWKSALEFWMPPSCSRLKRR